MGQGQNGAGDAIEFIDGAAAARISAADSNKVTVIVPFIHWRRYRNIVASGPKLIRFGPADDRSLVPVRSVSIIIIIVIIVVITYRTGIVIIVVRVYVLAEPKSRGNTEFGR